MSDLDCFYAFLVITVIGWIGFVVWALHQSEDSENADLG